MSETTTPVTEMHWTSEQARDEFLAEHARRKAAGEPLADMEMPIVIVTSGGEE